MNIPTYYYRQNYPPSSLFYVPRPHRQWIQTPYGKTFRCGHSDQKFVLMSYNILAQTLLEQHSYLYTEHVSQFLEWTHRLQCIQMEILQLRPAILCLQEVQESHLHQIEHALKPLNYAKPLYKQRTGANYDDGCAIFYNPDFFELIDHHTVEFYQPDVKVISNCFVFDFFFLSIHFLYVCVFVCRFSTVSM